MSTLSLRFEDNTLHRFERLLTVIIAGIESPVLARKVTRTDIIRMAVERGLTALESEHGEALTLLDAEYEDDNGKLPPEPGAEDPNTSTFDELVNGNDGDGDGDGDGDDEPEAEEAAT